MNRILNLCGPVVVVLGLAGCSSNSQQTSSETDSGGTALSQSIECPSTAQAFYAGMSSTSADGTTTVKITSDPASPSPNVYATWQLTIQDGSGKPLVGQKVTLVAIMQHTATYKHGLGLNVTVTEVGNGVYTASPIDFTMNGPWRAAVGVGTEDVAFDICLE